MKTIIILSAMFFTGLQTAYCQMGALKGSGKVVTKIFSFQNFDSIQLQDLDGKIEVEAGKAYSITIAIDDNLERLLVVNENNKTLIIALEKNENNKRYVENSNIKITITVPQLCKIAQSGNSNTYVKAIESKSFRIQSRGNGNIVIDGTAENFDVQKSGNGNVEAGKLLTKNANIVSTGNGDVKVNASETFFADGTGNGDIINKGKAKALPNSKQTGNGEIINN